MRLKNEEKNWRNIRFPNSHMWNRQFGYEKMDRGKKNLDAFEAEVWREIVCLGQKGEQTKQIHQIFR